MLVMISVASAVVVRVVMVVLPEQVEQVGEGEGLVVVVVVVMLMMVVVMMFALMIAFTRGSGVAAAGSLPHRSRLHQGHLQTLNPKPQTPTSTQVICILICELGVWPFMCDTPLILQPNVSNFTFYNRMCVCLTSRAGAA